MHALNHHISKEGFRLRGREMSRIDAFSDVVFGFALTLLVVSLEVPKTYHELHDLLLGFVPFGICFLFLMMIWKTHFSFFRHYGLHDFATIVINGILLFFVLFFVYPLKFLSTIFVRQFSATNFQGIFQNDREPREMMLVYSLGFAAVYFAITALYANAWRLRDDLHLNPLERTLTKTYLWDFFGVACVGVLAAVITLLLPLQHAAWSGYTFFAIGLYKTLHGRVSGKYIRRARAITPDPDTQPLPH